MRTPYRSFCLVHGRVVALALILGFPLASCRSPLWTQGGPPVREVLADWDDADAAVEVAAKKVEMGLLRSEALNSGRRYHLRTVGDEPVELDLQPADGTDPRLVRIEARVGRFGDPRREGQLAAAVARRLTQLRGVEHAPVR